MGREGRGKGREGRGKGREGRGKGREGKGKGREGKGSSGKERGGVNSHVAVCRKREWYIQCPCRRLGKLNLYIPSSWQSSNVIVFFF